MIAAGEVASPGIAIVFLAGIASFLSPCVLPLLPAYLSYVGGVSIDAVSEGSVKARRLLIPTLIFVAGFSTVFVVLGMSASFIGARLIANQRALRIGAGVLILFMGLVFMEVIRIPWLYGERRMAQRDPGGSVVRNYLMGLAFGFGWSPCIGPTLGATLAIASTSQTLARGALLLFVYSLGLGIPFVLAALGISRLTGALAMVRKHARKIRMVSGVILSVFGLLLVFDRVYLISRLIQRAMEGAGLDRFIGL